MIDAGMYRLLLGLAILVASVNLPLVFAGGPGARRAAAKSCYRIGVEAQPMAERHRHLAYVANDCDDWLQCSVWTDVNPQPPRMLSVAPGATEQVETNPGSEIDDPKAFGTCRPK